MQKDDFALSVQMNIHILKKKNFIQHSKSVFLSKKHVKLFSYTFPHFLRFNFFFLTNFKIVETFEKSFKF